MTRHHRRNMHRLIRTRSRADAVRILVRALMYLHDENRLLRQGLKRKQQKRGKVFL